MRIISHRGNIKGPNSCIENSPKAIDKILELGIDCEVDVRYFEGKLYLGHDQPSFPITEEFLFARLGKLWIHCKDKSALDFFVNQPHGYHYFWHQQDHYTITSKGYIWVFPGQQVLQKSIWVLPEQNLDLEAIKKEADETEILGLCSDYPSAFLQIRD